MSALPARFTFDLDLGRSERGPILSDAALAGRLEAARRDGYDTGFAEGERSAAAKAARQLSAAAEALSGRAAQLLAGRDEVQQRLVHEAVALAAGIGRKLAGGLLAKQPEAALVALLEQCLASLEGVPHLVIRCHPDLADRIVELAGPRLAAGGFAGRMVVEPDAGLKPGDGRIEWADGGIARNEAALSAEIDAAIAAFLAGARPEETNG